MKQVKTCFTASASRGARQVLEKLAQPVPGFSAEQTRDWRAPGVHIDDSPEICGRVVSPYLCEVPLEKEKLSSKSSYLSVPGL